MTLSPGVLINNRFRIISILGQGGMGSVYRAVDDNLGISVAVKDNLFLSEEYTLQFNREASILASLRHPNLPRVMDYFSIQGQGQYLIMDFIEGEDLRQRIERLVSLPERDVILIGAQVCDALQYMHTREQPVIHRDIKPGNIKITPDGEVFLVDFGLAKLMVEGQATTTGARAMTPGYSPPEQYGIAHTDSRTDIYSLGATIYAALTGVIPEDGLSRVTGKEELTPIRELRPKMSRRVATVIETALEIDPDDRYQTADKFKNDLLEAGELTESAPRRILIAPPPPLLDTNGEKTQTPPSKSLESKTPRFDTQIKRRRKARIQRAWFAVFTLILVSVLFASLLYLRPDLVSAIIASFYPPTPVGSVPPTAIPRPLASFTPLHPTKTELHPTQTIIQSTFTLVPTATKTPTITETEIVLKLGGGDGIFAFTSDRSGISQIWTMDTNGGNQVQLSNIPEGVCQPAWAPDGVKIAFISPCSDQKHINLEEAQIYTMNYDGSNLQKLPISQKGDYDPAWAPDGKRIAFSSLRKGPSHIFVYNFENNLLEELSDNQHPDRYPAWNPSGKQIAVARQVSQVNSLIYILSDRGQTQIQFSPKSGVNDNWPTWSPDGNFILISRSQMDPIIPRLVKVFYEDRGTYTENRIPPEKREDLGPVAEADISPDGQWIVFESWPDGSNHDIYIMDIDGGNLLRLTTDPGFDSSPTWRPKQAQ